MNANSPAFRSLSLGYRKKSVGPLAKALPFRGLLSTRLNGILCVGVREGSKGQSQVSIANKFELNIHKVCANIRSTKATSAASNPQKSWAMCLMPSTKQTHACSR